MSNENCIFPRFPENYTGRSKNDFVIPFAGVFPEILPDLARSLLTVTKRYEIYFRSTTNR